MILKVKFSNDKLWSKNDKLWIFKCMHANTIIISFGVKTLHIIICFGVKTHVSKTHQNRKFLFLHHFFTTFLLDVFTTFLLENRTF